jgi:hypothetical protein
MFSVLLLHNLCKVQAQKTADMATRTDNTKLLNANLLEYGPRCKNKRYVINTPMENISVDVSTLHFLGCVRTSVWWALMVLSEVW